MSTRIIHVQWIGPIALDNIGDYDDNSIDFGIYQVYGNHPVYGVETLLYIGKADEQTFCARLGQESWPDRASWEGKVVVHIGRLIGARTPTDEEWSKEIDLAESLLIVSNSPAYNKVGVAALTKAKDPQLRDVHVFNWGDRGHILPESSGARWSSEYDDLSPDSFYGS